MAAGEFSFRTAAEETWRIFRIMAEFVEGIDVLSRIGPAVSIFGSARTPTTDPYYQLAIELGNKLARARLAVITGGGPGIMQAANEGALEGGGTSVGLNIALPHEQVPNDFQNVSMNFHYFFVRKVMFIRYSLALACFPGGFGTMDEFFETMTLLQTHKTRPMKVVLMGRPFWEPLRAWMRDVMLNVHHCISPQDLDLFTITDDADEAVRAVVEFLEKDRSLAGEPRTEEEMAIATAQRLTAEGTLFGVPPQPARRDAEKK